MLVHLFPKDQMVYKYCYCPYKPHHSLRQLCGFGLAKINTFLMVQMVYRLESINEALFLFEYTFSAIFIFSHSHQS